MESAPSTCKNQEIDSIRAHADSSAQSSKDKKLIATHNRDPKIYPQLARTFLMIGTYLVTAAICLLIIVP